MSGNLTNLLFTVDGRIKRKTFWFAQLVCFIAEVAIFLLSIISPLFNVLLLAVLWALIAVSAKRFHDREKSGWWQLISIIPIIGWLWLFIELGCLKGTTGANKYGPDPLAK